MTIFKISKLINIVFMLKNFFYIQKIWNSWFQILNLTLRKLCHDCLQTVML